MSAPERPPLYAVPERPVTSWTADELMAMSFPEPTWAVPGLIAEGVTPGSLVAVCAEHGVTLHPLVVPDVIEFIEQRRGPRAKAIQAVDRYFPDAIARSWPEVEQFIHTKGLAS